MGIYFGGLRLSSRLTTVEEQGGGRCIALTGFCCCHQWLDIQLAGELCNIEF